MQWVCIYSGNSLQNAKLVSVTSDESIVREVARLTLDSLRVPPEDPVAQELEKGRKKALLEVIGRQGEQSSLDQTTE